MTTSKHPTKKVSVAEYRRALAAQPKFCDLCGTTLTAKRPDVASGRCYACRAAICGPMILAYTHWKEMGERYRRCCGGFNRERTYLYFHGKYFDDSYPLSKKGQPLQRGAHVSVEHGVSFYADRAQPYYLRDFDTYCDSQDYGDPVLYTSKNFWEEVTANFGSAAKAAWESDLQSCRSCGYHYTDGGCTCKDR